MVKVKSHSRRWVVEHRFHPAYAEPYWSPVGITKDTRAEAELAAQKRAQTFGEQTRVREETTKEFAEAQFETQRDQAIETADKEALEDARGRCTVPPWAFEKCVRIQEWAVEELRLLLMNDQDLYEEGPYSYKYRPMTLQVLDGAETWAELEYRPDAEAKLRKATEIRITETDPEKRKDQLAQEYADRLLAPIMLEPYTELPLEQRKAAVKETMKAVRGLIEDYTTSLRANWPRRG